MDQRLYHYQYRRPRLSNPTYSSFNVGNSMTFFMNNPNQSNIAQGRSSYQQSYAQQNNKSYYENSNNYRQNPADTPPVQSRQRSQSNLSNYGNNSLAFNERQIYNKQNSKFNIISLKPKQVPDRIKQYPKLTLQDKDNYYFKKVQLMREQQMNTSRIRNSSMPTHPENVAGRHTFAPDDGKNPLYYQHGRYFTPKMLNHADEVSHIM